MQAPQQAQQAQQARTPIEYINGYIQNVQHDLRNIEQNISDLELAYYQAEHSQAGNVLKGFEGYLSSKEALRKRSRSWRPEDRLFSLSSRSSPLTQELQAEDMDALQPGGFGKKGYAQKGYNPGKGKR